ncbi:uncharacterized protein LOC110022973 [Phalaenopsis equestris]|uniref:uncharacterized protein LOC110022973 n=1 Tax=Phalaenopsis equestris TaxID=78828 RepID=UPI0009E658A7|nr:uncharacterized protein LOC110022973 [Phalaenopsis equestris]
MDIVSLWGCLIACNGNAQCKDDGRCKDAHITGDVVAPTKDDPKFRTLNAKNHMVMSWLINFMTNDIGKNFLLYDTAKSIWDAARETYYHSYYTSKFFEIESIIHDLLQGDQSLTQSCTPDSNLYRQIIEQKMIFKFLLGLNNSPDHVCSRVLSIKPLPSIREAFSEVRREESRQKVMLGPISTSHNLSVDASALVARVPPPRHSDNPSRKGHPMPADWKPRSDRTPRANSVVAADDLLALAPSPFSKKQLDLLHKLIGKPPDLAVPNPIIGMLAHQETTPPSALPMALSLNSPALAPLWLRATGFGSVHITQNILL